MSYVSVVASGLIGFVIILWFTTKRGVFKGPQIDVALLEERRNAAIQGEVIGSVEVASDSGFPNIYGTPRKSEQKFDTGSQSSVEKREFVSSGVD